MIIKEGIYSELVTTRKVFSVPAHFDCRTAHDILKMSGTEASYDVDGVPLKAMPQGIIQFHGDETAPPRWMLRVSRDVSGKSINMSHLSDLLFTGHSTAQYVNDGAELETIEVCQFEQYKNDASCVILSNKNRPLVGDNTNRVNATNSGHSIRGCSFQVWGQQNTQDRSRGACVRMLGEVTDVWFKNCWFSGNAPALVLVDEPDEQWPGPTPGGRWNTPRRIVLEDCITESQPVREIVTYGFPQLQGVQFAGMLQFFDPRPNGLDWVLELRGSSVHNFILVQR